MRSHGRIYRPKDRKVWMLAYYAPTPGGKRELVRESAKTTDEEVARKRLALRMRQIGNAEDGLSDFEGPAQKRVSVNQLFDELLEFYAVKQIKGLRVVRRRLSAEAPLRTTFGQLRTVEVTAGRIDAYVKARLKDDKKNATVNREIELLRRAFRLGAKRGRIVRLPAFPEKLPERNARQGFLETGDFERILHHLPEPLGDAARFAFATGWRVGMLLDMTWSHVDRAGRVVMLPDSKNDDPQAIPLSDDLREIIERRWDARDYPLPGGASGVSVYVFHIAGQPIKYWQLNEAWAAARTAAGLPGKLFHDLRRTAARNMVRGGVPEEIAMKVTGHRTRSMFNRYNIASLEDKLEALNKARAYARKRAGEHSNVTPIGAGKSNGTSTRATFSEGNGGSVWESNPPVPAEPRRRRI